MKDASVIIDRLRVLKRYAMLSPSDGRIIDDAIEYIEANEERMKVVSDPLFPKNKYSYTK